MDLEDTHKSSLNGRHYGVEGGYHTMIYLPDTLARFCTHEQELLANFHCH